MINVVSDEENKISARRIELQNNFAKYTAENEFSYQEWLNPAPGSFFESYKKEMDEINAKIAPELTY